MFSTERHKRLTGTRYTLTKQKFRRYWSRYIDIEMVIAVLLFGCCLATFLSSFYTHALNWASSSVDHATMFGCMPCNISLPWSFSAENSERIMDIQWYFQASDREARVVASRVNGQFVSYGPTPLQPEMEAGLLLLGATPSDSGRYNVVINSLSANGSVNIFTRSAQVEIAEAPMPTNGHLLVQLQSGNSNTLTGALSIQLACGPLLSTGQPPVSAMWTTPEGREIISTEYSDGFFGLTLPNPVTEGNYSCHLARNSSSTRCLESASPLLEQTTAYVSGVDVKLALVEARHKQLIEENSQLQNNEKNLISQIQELQTVNSNQTIQIRELTSLVHILQAENANQSRHVLDLAQLVDRLRPKTCRDVQRLNNVSGLYDLYVPDLSTVRVYCDQVTDGGGWTVFQRRRDGSTDFYRNWNNYTNGFGDLNGEFWLGLDNVHALTSQEPQILRVDIEDWDNTRAFAAYSNFSVKDKLNNYTLHFGSFLRESSAGDSLVYHNRQQFTTWDHYRDVPGARNCAMQFHGAWWYHLCYDSNLNGDYKTSGEAPNEDGVSWRTFRGVYHSLKVTEMKFRPA